MVTKKSKSEIGSDFLHDALRFDPQQDKKRLAEELLATKEENERLLYFQETGDKLAALKSALERWEKTIDEVTEQIEQVGEVDESHIREIQEIAESIIEKIESLDDMSDYAMYVPAKLRVTKDEYQKAVFEPHHRAKTLKKIHDALTLMAGGITESSGWLNIFADSFMFLSRSLILIQETHIDMKEGLESVTKLEKAAD